MTDPLDAPSPPAEARPAGDARPAEAGSIREAQETIAGMISERPDDEPTQTGSETSRAAESSPSPAAAPAFHLDPENTSIGRVQRAYLAVKGIAPYTAPVPCTAGDIDALRDRISPAQYHELHAAVAARDSADAEQSAAFNNEVSQLHAAYPELVDPRHAESERAQLLETARLYLGDDAAKIIASQTDHRAILILRDLKRYHQLRQENAALKAGVHVSQREASDEPAPRRQSRQRHTERVTIGPMNTNDAARLLEQSDLV